MGAIPNNVHPVQQGEPVMENPSLPKRALHEQTKKQKIWEWTKFGILLLAIYLLVTNVIGFTRVSGHSMDPTLKDKSFLLVNKLSTYLVKPSYGDVVIVKQDGYKIVKRVIGVPGDTITFVKGQLYVNNYAIPELYATGVSDDMKPVTIQQGEVFIVGDNREPGASLDSRDLRVGPISDSFVEGYAIVSVFPFYKISKPLEL